jgi:Xaa-Pro aminopeptidase
LSAARLDKLRAKLAGLGVDGLIVNRYENRRWLSGVTAHDASPTANAGWLIVTPARAVLVTSFLYYGAAVAEADGVEVVQIPRDRKLHETAAEQLRELDIRRVGFEEAWVTFQMHRQLAEELAGAVELAPLAAVVDPLRAVKDAAELAVMRRAVALSDAAMEALFGELKPGMTEVEAAWFLEAHMRERGAEGMAFEPGVAAGPNSAVPHHKPSDRAIRAGEPIWIDIGALVDGYRSDITRTVALGQPDDQYRRLWQEVLEAQKRVLEFIRPGVTGRDCDTLARDYLDSVGLGEAFGHGLGHGVGLLIHEDPRLSRFSDGDAKLEAGMVTSVEPGAYIDGWGGVRHEELVVLVDDGIEVLTRASMPFTL